MSLALKLLGQSVSTASRRSGALTPKTPCTPKTPKSPMPPSIDCRSMVTSSPFMVGPSSVLPLTPRATSARNSPFPVENDPVTPRLVAVADALRQHESKAPRTPRTPKTPKTPCTPAGKPFPVLLGRNAPDLCGETSPARPIVTVTGAVQRRRVHFDESDPTTLHALAHEAFHSRQRRLAERRMPFRV